MTPDERVSIFWWVYVCHSCSSFCYKQLLPFCICVNQNLPTHTGEHSHFNRLPLPMWRVHLKGCAHHLTHSPQPTDPAVGCLPKMMPCSPQPRCLMMRPLGLSHRTNCLAPHLLSWINPHAATAATPLHAAGSCHASLLHRPPACHMPCAAHGLSHALRPSP